MKKLSLSLAVALVALLGTTAIAQQTGQSQPTSRAGASGGGTSVSGGGMTSNNSGVTTSSGMRDSTTGITGSGPERGTPNGSPAAAKATGPNGQPSNNETPPK